MASILRTILREGFLPILILLDNFSRFLAMKCWQIMLNVNLMIGLSILWAMRLLNIQQLQARLEKVGKQFLQLRLRVLGFTTRNLDVRMKEAKLLPTKRYTCDLDGEVRLLFPLVVRLLGKCIVSSKKSPSGKGIHLTFTGGYLDRGLLDDPIRFAMDCQRPFYSQDVLWDRKYDLK